MPRTGQTAGISDHWHVGRYCQDKKFNLWTFAPHHLFVPSPLLGAHLLHSLKVPWLPPFYPSFFIPKRRSVPLLSVYSVSILPAILRRHGDLHPETKAFTPTDVTDAYLVQKYPLTAKCRAWDAPWGRGRVAVPQWSGYTQLGK